jgi:predicted GNAT superfamily acetyltransferase
LELLKRGFCGGGEVRLENAVSRREEVPYSRRSQTMNSPSAAPITIRHLDQVPEYDQCVLIEHAVWGKEIAVPNGMFIVAHHTGGQVFAAFDRKKMVGFTLAVAGIREFSPNTGAVLGGKYTPFMHSHMTAVLSEYRNSGVGRRLKLFQREDALRRGIPLVEWTYDPLEIKNGYFNLMRLGVVVRRLIPNCYGITESPLHSGLPTDRFVPEWWLDSERVRRIVGSEPLAIGRIAQRISLPRNMHEIKAGQSDRAVELQADFRARCEKAFAAGLVVTGMELHDETVDYVLQAADDVAGLKLPQLAKH